jgi:hypothetical protein
LKTLRAVAIAVFIAHAAHGKTVTVHIQETVAIEIPGATAAYTTNPDIADVVLGGVGRLSLTGHSAGTTQLMVVSISGLQSFLITVAAAATHDRRRPDAGMPLTLIEGRYSSEIGRVQSTIDVAVPGVARRSEFHLQYVRDLDDERNRFADGLASIFFRHVTPTRELTFLDDLVDVSPLTVSNTQVRGLHLASDSFELHAGYASSTRYDDLFLPMDRRWVAGAGYAIDAGSIRLEPSLYGFFTERANTGARRGIVGALTAEHRSGDTLYVRAEIAASRSIAAAGEIRLSTARDQLRASLFFKPENFPTLGLQDAPGAHLELDASHRAMTRLSLDAHGSYSRLKLAALSQTVDAAGVGFRYAATPRISLAGGVDTSTVNSAARSLRTIGLPVSALYEAPGFGVAASYRLFEHSAASRRGDALRLSAHTGRGRFTAAAWGDRQRHAPTLELIFRDAPGLDLALLRLGISVRDPEDVARALRDNAALIDLGYITGVNVDLTPRRMQAGLNLGWTATSERSDRLRLLSVYSRDEGIRATRDSMITTLTWSRRILGATDLYASYSSWQTSVSGSHHSGQAMDVGVRQQFSGLPRLFRRSGALEGFAFLDPEMRGSRTASSTPLAEIEVTLDGGRTTRTDRTGAYTFRDVAPGLHTVSAQLPPMPRSFFTTASHVETQAPARVDFGVVWAAARIAGRVVSDAGVGVAGVVLSAIALNGVPIGAASDAEGSFVFAVPPGSFRIVLAQESLPAGYSISGGSEQHVMAETDRPQSIAFAVLARRSIAGYAAGASEVRIESLKMSVPVDRNGYFLFRSMTAGTFTLTAEIRGQLFSRTLTVPARPTMIDEVVLGKPPPLSAVAPVVGAAADAPLAARGAVSSPALSNATHVVQTGAFRNGRNARELVIRLQRHGETPFIAVTRGVTVVYVGPFATRLEAVRANRRLQKAGFDTFVASRPRLADRAAKR